MTGAERGAGIEVPTSQGPARVVLDSPERPWFLVALTHGAGGDVDSADLLAVRNAVLKRGGMVARISQPYRVRGARAPGSPDRQDEAWVEIISALRAAAAQTIEPGGSGAVPLVQGGRSNGARVACRTAAAVGAVGVIALAFPLHPPGHPDKSRAGELRVPGRKVLVVNGERDPFGIPKRGAGRRVVVLPGETHALSRHPEAAAKAVRAWLPHVLGARTGGLRGKDDETGGWVKRGEGGVAGGAGQAAGVSEVLVCTVAAAWSGMSVGRCGPIA